MNQTRWNVAITIPTLANEAELTHLSIMLSLMQPEVISLGNSILVKATTEPEADSYAALRAVMYPVEQWLRILGKVVNYFRIEVDALDVRGALGQAAELTASPGRWV